MQIFDLKNMPSFPYAEREKNVFLNGMNSRQELLS